MRTNNLKVEQVERLPEEVMEGILYISKEFEITTHKCPCGCGLNVELPFSDPKLFWSLKENNGKVSMKPSILSTLCPNRSHYYITDNQIDWK